MKSKITLLCIGLAIVSYFGLTSFKSNAGSKKFEHLFIMSENHDLDGVFCSEDGKTFKKHNYDKQGEGMGDLNPIINLIHEYEDEGWELMSVDLNSPRGGHGFWLRRMKN